ncbi:hypothetical protein KBY58_01395 [Cyanobium sp. HWJ4-Hawea]|uniref:hypothetical protein n=1 Tax=Cyanobium sp. HWJ4-Hawea TaxID=2823713 RepID=UPI0020CFC645|nr:hypothetical protein [Cyanobium sp. HWJ4-Hawea]MCP9808086.1 hypothetical protein [Cyanobium sp. HWJ4-Hawea]
MAIRALGTLLLGGLLLTGCSEQPLPERQMRSDDCLRQLTFDQLAEQLKRCDEVVKAFPNNPGPLNDRYLLRSLIEPRQNRAACQDIRRANALAKQAKAGSLGITMQNELKLRLELCNTPLPTPTPAPAPAPAPAKG